ncbi:MAG: hypothetical protein KDC00_01430 [Flavobacteriales bacterium]|nr:hypothetical protein [Flavobacteriales bacterium]
MLGRWRERVRKLGQPLLQLAALLLIGLVYYLGIRSERTGFVRDVIDPGFRKLSDPVLNAFRGSPPPVPRLRLVLDSTAWDSLLVLNEMALRHGSVPRSGNAVFAGSLQKNGSEIPVVVSLCEGGMRTGIGQQWPIHVRALPGDTILGMQTFDAIPVRDATPLWSLLLMALLADQGNVTLDQAIAEVDVNGTNLGLCMLQGRPDGTMLTAWSRGNGPVLRYDDAMLIDARSAMAQRRFPSTPPPQGDWTSAPLLLQASEGDVLNERSELAIARLDGFRAGRYTAAEVFDVAHMARLLALCDLLGMQQSVEWWDLRFLVDSLTQEFVAIPLHSAEHAPVASILAAQIPSAGRPSAQGTEMVHKILTDTHMAANYLAYLDTFSAPGWWEAALARTERSWEPARRAVNAEFPRIDLDRTVIEHDRTVIRQTLEPKEMVLAYMRDAQDPGDGIAVANVHALPVEVFAVVFTSGDTVDLIGTTRLSARGSNEPLQYTVLPMPRYRGPGAPSEVLVRLSSALKSRSVRIRSWNSFGAN